MISKTIERRLGAAGAIVLGLFALTGELFMQRQAEAATAVDVVGALRATSAAPGATGTFRERSSVGASARAAGARTTLVVRAKSLAPNSTYQVRLSGKPIGTLATGAGGSGRAVFSTPTRARAQALPVDPRGRLLSVNDANGDDMLEGEVDDPTTPGGIQCCLNTAEEQGCDSLLPADCSAAGGIDMGAGTCDPDPCTQQGDDTDEDGDADGEVDDDAVNGEGGLAN